MVILCREGLVLRNILILLISLIFIAGCSGNTEDVSGGEVENVPEENIENVENVEIELEEAIEDEIVEEVTEVEVYNEIRESMGSLPTRDTIEGSGGQSYIFNVLVGGMVKFVTENEGSSNFKVHVEDEAGNRIGSVANHIGNFSGHQFLYLEEGEYILQVRSNGSWSIDIEQPFIHEFIEERVFNGNGSITIGPLTSKANRLEFLGEHKGDSNFMVAILDVFGNRLSGAFNEIGEYQGNHITTNHPETIFYIDIRADGDWSIEIKE